MAKSDNVVNGVIIGILLVVLIVVVVMCVVNKDKKDKKEKFNVDALGHPDCIKAGIISDSDCESHLRSQGLM